MAEFNGNEMEHQEAGSPEGLPGARLPDGRGQWASNAQKGRPVDPEVGHSVKGRRYSTAYKVRILEEADRCQANGQIGMLLRREELYSSTLNHWRRWRENMGKPSSEERRGKYRDLTDENTKLKRENERPRLKLKRAEGLIELQIKYPRSWGSNSQTGRSTRTSYEHRSGPCFNVWGQSRL